MPIYVVKCNVCKHQEDIFRTVAEYDSLPDHCGERMSRVITAPYVAADIQPYRSIITGEEIGSRSTHREHLKRHNAVEIGNEKPDFDKQSLPDVGGLKEELAARMH